MPRPATLHVVPLLLMAHFRTPLQALWQPCCEHVRPNGVVLQVGAVGGFRRSGTSCGPDRDGGSTCGSIPDRAVRNLMRRAGLEIVAQSDSTCARDSAVRILEVLSDQISVRPIATLCLAMEQTTQSESE